MDQNTIKKIVNDANHSYYNNTSEVDNYLTRPYHALRVQIAVLELDRRIKQSFPNPIDRIVVLEIAGASGTTAKQIQRLGYQVILSDNQELPLKAAMEKGLDCVRFDANDDFPFPDNSFHAIFAGEIIEHIFDTEKFCSECCRVLKRNGVFTLTTPNLAAFQDRISFLFGQSPRQVDPMHQYRKLHIRPFTKSKLVQILSHVGFKHSRVLSNYVRVQIGKRIIFLNRFLAIAFPSFGGSLIISAIKP